MSPPASKAVLAKTIPNIPGVFRLIEVVNEQGFKHRHTQTVKFFVGGSASNVQDLIIKYYVAANQSRLVDGSFRFGLRRHLNHFGT